MKWNDQAYTAIVEQYPVLEGKSETVALATWLLAQDPETSPDRFRQVSAETGVNVRGRAVGSAREILGIKPKTQSKKKGRKKAGRRKAGSRTRTAAASANGAEELGGFVQAVRALEKDRDDMRRALVKIRDVIESAL